MENGEGEQPPERGRWMRKEMLFLIIVLAAVVLAIFAAQFTNVGRPAPGRPIGGMTTNAAGETRPN